jgi:hypothetical protein
MIPSRRIFLLPLLLGASIACASFGVSISTVPSPVADTPIPVVPAPNLPPAPVQIEMLPPTPSSPKVIVQRLQITYLGLDGHRLIGSGCPGQDGMGSIENYHFMVEGVDIDRHVERVLVTGDNSTLTWESPCKDDWGLVAKEVEPGTWEIFIAPSLPTRIYTILFFYNDNTFALGMTNTR